MNKGRMFLTVICIVALIALSVSITASSVALSQSEQNGDNRIQLKGNCLVVGPDVTLGDISYVSKSGILDRQKRAELAAVIIRKAPPPGEATDISFGEIKQRLRRMGFGSFTKMLIGPRTVRVITAHEEIDKAFIREALA